MLYAVDEHGTKIRAVHDREGVCPGCKAPMVPNCGPIKIHHWAHKTLVDCDISWEPEGDWHLSWKEHAPPEFTEVRMKQDGKLHIADIKTRGGLVLELQHSSIDLDTIAERESFYKPMIWLFDAERFRDRLTIERCSIEREGPMGYKYQWKRAPPTLATCSQPVYLDLRDGYILELDTLGQDFPKKGTADVLSYRDFVERFLYGTFPSPTHPCLMIRDVVYIRCVFCRKELLRKEEQHTWCSRCRSEERKRVREEASQWRQEQLRLHQIRVKLFEERAALHTHCKFDGNYAPYARAGTFLCYECHALRRCIWCGMDGSMAELCEPCDEKRELQMDINVVEGVVR